MKRALIFGNPFRIPTRHTTLSPRRIELPGHIRHKRLAIERREPFEKIHIRNPALWPWRNLQQNMDTCPP